MSKLNTFKRTEAKSEEKYKQIKETNTRKRNCLLVNLTDNNNSQVDKACIEKCAKCEFLQAENCQTRISKVVSIELRMELWLQIM